ncbi:MAG: cell division protein FtsZ [Candidatus Dormibacteraeota bacterium]|nr:cell division protein FtsZ [Candidatus Dormibacteraeota bacterium]MBO0704201.1 cell division protein FtsZ [Candidatus Dormibacteraeota bacterium]MBO0761337.1 cell division protein FtsZ [Candidatus Dormibacteraeota bacterium]
MSSERTGTDRQDGRARIKVVGCGGGGGNAVNRMISAALKGVEFIAVNTDLQALERCNADIKVNIGRKLTRGLGSGGDWTKGRDAADESRAELTELVKESDMVFITAGMGGGTGTGSSSVVAEVAKDQGALTIGVVTRPFRWEGKVRAETAEEGVNVLRDRVDALIIIPNDRLTQVVDKRTTLEEAFKIADDVLRQGVQGIADLIVNPGIINLDFADVKSIMSSAGEALMGIGFGSGDNRAEDAAKQAVSSPLLETSIDGAQGILFNVTAGKDITLFECEKAAEIIKASADPNASIIFGVVNDDRMQDEVKITVVASGFGPAKRPQSAQQQQAAQAQQAQQAQQVQQGGAVEEEPARYGELRPRQPTPPPAPEPRPSYDVGEQDDLDVPAFLRNRF